MTVSLEAFLGSLVQRKAVVEMVAVETNKCQERQYQYRDLSLRN